ncbi:hypothetical protein Tco_0754079 [Tanacetum coccineum]
MWLKLTPLGLMKGKSMLELYHYATSRTLTYYECGNQGYYKSDCPELKNGNKSRGAGTRGMVLALVGREPNKDLDDMEDNTNA